jgi:curved DNA-binding protein CbpA
MTMDPYATLGLPHTASDRQVRQTYRRLAKQYHPDLHPDTPTSEQMRRVNEAWEILSSPQRRARYDADAALRGSPAGHWAAPHRQSAASTPRTATWSPAWTSSPGGQAYRPPRARPYVYAEEDGPGWTGVLIAIAFGVVVIVGVLAGLLPAPLFGLALFLVAQRIFARFT